MLNQASDMFTYFGDVGTVFAHAKSRFSTENQNCILSVMN